MKGETGNLRVRVDYLTRIEGHGNIVVEARGGVVEACRFEVVESPRLFEAVLRGRSIFEARHISSRICGICACAHSMASLQAAEQALGVTVSEQTVLLRRLLLDLEILDSHVLHVCLLALPDLAGEKSFLSLAGSREKTVRRALRMKRTFNDAAGAIAGRHIHPVSCAVGGFTRLPGPGDLEKVRDELAGLRPDVTATVETMGSLSFPDFEGRTEYAALVGDGGTYPLFQGDVGSSGGLRFKKEQYRAHVVERVEKHSTAKHASLSQAPYAVGALARVNLNGDGLHPMARDAASTLGVEAPCRNPYLNTLAQAVELVHCLEEAVSLVEALLERGIDAGELVPAGRNEGGFFEVREGEGVGAVEAPRGTLYHFYRIDGKGVVREADCVIPTGQNLAGIEADMRALVPAFIDRAAGEAAAALEMLVRAYDPCISCSTHLVELGRRRRDRPDRGARP